MSVTLRLRRNRARLSTFPRAGSPPGVRLLGRLVRIALSALALSATLGLGGGSGTAFADAGGVYVDPPSTSPEGNSPSSGRPRPATTTSAWATR